MSDGIGLLPLMDELWLDIDVGLEKSGNVDEYLKLLEIFYRDIDNKANMLDRYFKDGNLKDYTIKVHALKSSARLIGATAFGEKAWKLEDAGKREDRDYIFSHHRELIDELLSFKKPLSRVFKDDTASDASKPVPSGEIMQDLWRDMYKAADDMDCDAIDAVIRQIEKYRIPDNYRELYSKVKAAADDYEYEAITDLINEYKIYPQN